MPMITINDRREISRDRLSVWTVPNRAAYVMSCEIRKFSSFGRARHELACRLHRSVLA